MIYKSLNLNPAEALNGTTVLNALAVNNGAKLLRVHDVKEAVQTVKLLSIYCDSGD
jgi:dihydropteroate synthase